MKKTVLCFTALLFFSMTSFADDKMYIVNLVNQTNTAANATPVDSFGSFVCADADNGTVNVLAHQIKQCPAENTFTTGGTFQNIWIVDNHKVNCPPAYLPDEMNGQLFNFVLNVDKTNPSGYSCIEASIQKK